MYFFMLCNFKLYWFPLVVVTLNGTGIEAFRSKFEGLFGILNWVVCGLLAELDQEELLWISSSNIFLNFFFFNLESF
jgi:hypothetical protein